MKKKVFVLIAAIVLSGMAMGLEAKKPKKRVRKAAKEQVWTHISGFYTFSNGEHSIGIDYLNGEFKGYINGPGYEDNEDGFDGSVDEKTGLITIVDEQGKVIFTGKMYRGGNQLKGELNGKPITLEGLCGL